MLQPLLLPELLSCAWGLLASQGGRLTHKWISVPYHIESKLRKILRPDSLLVWKTFLSPDSSPAKQASCVNPPPYPTVKEKRPKITSKCKINLFPMYARD